MNNECKLSPRRVATAYADKRSNEFRAVVATWGVGDVVVYDPEEEPDVTALASVDVVVDLGNPGSGDQKRLSTQMVLSYDRKGIELSEAELVRACLDLVSKTGNMVPPGGFPSLKEAVRKSVAGWLNVVKTVMAGELEKKVEELYPEEGKPELKAVIDNEFKKAQFAAALMDTGFDPVWVKGRFAARGHKLDGRAEKYVEARVAVAREAAGW